MLVMTGVADAELASARIEVAAARRIACDVIRMVGIPCAGQAPSARNLKGLTPY